MLADKPSPLIMNQSPAGGPEAIGDADQFTKSASAPRPESRVASTREERLLLSAASGGNDEAVKALLADGVSARVAEESPPHATALCNAAFEGHAECVALLLPHSDPNQMCAQGTALHFAASGGNAECLKLLLPHCDPAALDSFDCTALIVAAGGGNLESAQLLLPVSDANAVSGFTRGNRNALMAAAAHGGVSAGGLIALLAPGTENLDAKDSNGRTALMHAIRNGGDLRPGQAPAYAPLLGRADANIVDGTDGFTALEMAIQGDWIEDVKRLAPFTDLHTPRQGWCPIDWAVRHAAWEIADFLAPLSRPEDAAKAFEKIGQEGMPHWAARLENEALRAAVEETAANNLSNSSQPQKKAPLKRKSRAL